MYETYLKKTTNQLREDLKQTMKVYNTEKENLMKQLSNLRHKTEIQSTSLGLVKEDNTSSDFMSSEESSNKKSRYFHAPDIFAKKKQRWDNGKNSDYKARQDKKKKEREEFKLPVIYSASKRSEWESGKNMTKRGALLGSMEPLSGTDPIAKVLLNEGLKIPKVNDPQRCDSVIDTSQSKPSKKKVTFADENQGKLSHGTETEHNGTEYLQPYRQPYFLPGLVGHKDQYSHIGKKKKKKKGNKTKLPLVSESKKEILLKNPAKASEQVNEWKALYVNITNHKERTQALSDILYAVRLKMMENEQTLRGQSETSPRYEHTLCDFLLNGQQAINKVTYRNEFGKKRRDVIPLNTATRLGRRSNATQLQNYLQKLSHARRMIEHMEAEEYRLAHYQGHKALQQISSQQEISTVVV
ncbi:hypothetical protein ACJMK2_019544 [Sinanodonta woodiana]|uniref:Uncharacterized protein n=1 Tax=Sinanodonta woodiana TaxID=1069815 RepID=A0ABD3TX40_SINWO